MSPLAPLQPSEPTANHSDMERRKFARSIAEHFPAIKVLTRPSFQPFLALIRDFSAQGLAIVCDHLVHPGTVVAIQLQRKQVGVSGILSASVIHCTPLPHGAWLCGCRLSRCLTPDELHGLSMAIP
jgi:hypothetical protein